MPNGVNISSVATYCCLAPHSWITHRGRVTHICANKLTSIGSDNGLSPGWHQAIIWTNTRILLIRTPGTNSSDISSKIHTFSLKKMHLNMSSEKRRPFILGLNVLSNVIGNVSTWSRNVRTCGWAIWVRCLGALIVCIVSTVVLQKIFWVSFHQPICVQETDTFANDIGKFTGVGHYEVGWKLLQISKHCDIVYWCFINTKPFMSFIYWIQVPVCESHNFRYRHLKIRTSIQVRLIHA